MPTPTVGATGGSEVVRAPGSGPQRELGPVRVCTRAGRPARGAADLSARLRSLHLEVARAGSGVLAHARIVQFRSEPPCFASLSQWARADEGGGDAARGSSPHARASRVFMPWSRGLARRSLAGLHGQCIDLAVVAGVVARVRFRPVATHVAPADCEAAIQFEESLPQLPLASGLRRVVPTRAPQRRAPSRCSRWSSSRRRRIGCRRAARPRVRRTPPGR